MMDVLLFAGFVVAVGLGWGLGCYQFAGRRGSNKGAAEVYYQGMGSLLGESRDVATKKLLLERYADKELVDTHFALGRLFRSRGELADATRVHQELLAHPQLATGQRLQVQFELAKDYMTAGLYDRAERLLRELLAADHADQSVRVESLGLLLEIYQREREWRQAIEIAKQLQCAKAGDKHQLIAQFYCELASQFSASGHPVEAKTAFGQALAHDKNCVRAYLQRAQLQMASGAYAEAIKSLKQVKTCDPAFLAESLPLLQTCYNRLGKSRGFALYLRESLRDGTLIGTGFNPLSFLRQAELLNRKLRQTLHQQAECANSLQAMHILIDLHLYEAAGKEVIILQKLRDYVAQLIAVKSAYVCQQCGYQGNQLLWLCPGCQQWATIKPSHTLD